MLDPNEINDFLTSRLDRYMKNALDQSNNDKLTKCLNILEGHKDKIRRHLSSAEENFSHDTIASNLHEPAKVTESAKQNKVAMCGLSLSEIQRYSRQLLLPELRVSGQLKLKKASILIVGAGGLGCPAGLYLAAAGVGRIGIVDADTVDLSNLHRQVAHKQSKLGIQKAESLCQALKDLNAEVQVVSYKCALTSRNALKIFNENYDVILDATDNPATRYLINDACQLSGKRMVHLIKKSVSK